MNETQAQQKAVLLHLRTKICQQLDEVTQELGMTRTAFINQAIQRNIEFTEKYHIPDIEEFSEIKSANNLTWGSYSK